MGLPLAEGASDEFAMLDFHHERGPITWMFERAAPLEDSPDGRLGLDISLDDEEQWASVADRAQELGALRVSAHEESGVRWIEMRDPDRNPFRVFAPRPR